MTPSQRLRAAAQLAPQVIPGDRGRLAAWLEQHAHEHNTRSGGCGWITCLALAVADALLQTHESPRRRQPKLTTGRTSPVPSTNDDAFLLEMSAIRTS